MSLFINSRVWAVCLLATFAIGSGAPGAGWAGGTQGEPDRSANPVVSVVMSSQLSRYARQRGHAMAMMVAADLMRNVEIAISAGEQRGMRPLATSLADALPNAEALYVEARSFAAGREDFLAIIDEAEQSGSRGVVTAVEALTGRLGPKESKTFEFAFTGDSDAAAGVTRPGGKTASGADGDTDVDLYVADDKGSPVCISESPGVPELCRWTPRRTGTFRVKIENRLNAPAEYVLVVK